MKRISTRVHIRAAVEIGRHLKSVKESGVADHIGGYSEFIALVGYSRQQADRLVQLYERISRRKAAI